MDTDQSRNIDSHKLTVHAGHIITEFENVNGLTKFRVQGIGEAKERGQTLTLEKAKHLAETFGADLLATEQTPEGTQTLVPGVEPITERQRLEKRMQAPKQGGNAPCTAGLFDTNGRNQIDMFG